MFYKCSCGKVKSASPFKSIVEKRWLCDLCRRGVRETRLQGEQNTADRQSRVSLILRSSPHGGTGRRNGLKIRS